MLNCSQSRFVTTRIIFTKSGWTVPAFACTCLFEKSYDGAELLCTLAEIHGRVGGESGPQCNVIRALRGVMDRNGDKFGVSGATIASPYLTSPPRRTYIHVYSADK